MLWRLLLFLPLDLFVFRTYPCLVFGGCCCICFILFFFYVVCFRSGEMGGVSSSPGRRKVLGWPCFWYEKSREVVGKINIYIKRWTVCWGVRKRRCWTMVDCPCVPLFVLLAFLYFSLIYCCVVRVGVVHPIAAFVLFRPFRLFFLPRFLCTCVLFFLCGFWKTRLLFVSLRRERENILWRRHVISPT